MGILHGQSRCRASDRGAESKINGRKMRSKSRSRELSLKGHFWTPYTVQWLDVAEGLLDTKRPPAKSWWVQKLSADFTAD